MLVSLLGMAMPSQPGRGRQGGEWARAGSISWMHAAMIDFKAMPQCGTAPKVRSLTLSNKKLENSGLGQPYPGALAIPSTARIPNFKAQNSYELGDQVLGVMQPRLLI